MSHLTVAEIRRLTEQYHATRPEVVPKEIHGENFIYNEASLLRGEELAMRGLNEMYPETIELGNAKVTQHKRIVEGLNKTYAAKNKDYGDAFGKSLDKRGLIAALVRMDDKMNRFDSLVEAEEIEVVDESLQDTLLDLANYAIMTAMWLEDQNTEAKFQATSAGLDASSVRVCGGADFDGDVVALSEIEQQKLEQTLRGFDLY